MLNKTLLGSAAVLVTMVGAQAADLPSKKAAPATYVKICDAYGAGFFFIPGTDTCIKVGGYTRYEVQYTPGKDILAYTPAVAAKTSTTQTAGGSAVVTAATAAKFAVSHYATTQDTFGTEYRGRIDVDARTPTSMGVARSFISVRGSGTNGLRTSANDYTAGTSLPNVDAKNQSITLERAFVQWAGFTAGIATSNYAFIPSMTYTANLWSGYANGQRQLAYTAVLGGGFSATVAIEDKSMNNGDAGSTSITNIDTANQIVANVRLDQAWGFAVLHGMAGKNSTTNDALTANTFGALSPVAAVAPSPAVNAGQRTENAYAIGATVNFKLDAIAKGDQIWLTTNYTDGILGQVTGNPIGNPNDSSSGGRVLGGVMRKDNNIMYMGKPTGGVDTYGNVKAWNVGAQAVHYWDAKWRSMFTAAYVSVSPPTQIQTTQVAWGKGNVWEARGSVIYSPVSNFDIGLEVQYMKNSSKLQNQATDTSAAATAWAARGWDGLTNSNWTSKLRVERQF